MFHVAISVVFEDPDLCDMMICFFLFLWVLNIFRVFLESLLLLSVRADGRWGGWGGGVVVVASVKRGYVLNTKSRPVFCGILYSG